MQRVGLTWSTTGKDPQVSEAGRKMHEIVFPDSSSSGGGHVSFYFTSLRSLVPNPTVKSPGKSGGPSRMPATWRWRTHSDGGIWAALRKPSRLWSVGADGGAGGREQRLREEKV